MYLNRGAYPASGTSIHCTSADYYKKMKKLIFCIILGSFCFIEIELNGYACHLNKDSLSINAAIIGSPRKYGDSVKIRFENHTNDTVVFRVEVMHKVFNDDSLVFESVRPLTTSIFCENISSDLYKATCYKKVLPNSSFDIDITSFIKNWCDLIKSGNCVEFKFLGYPTEIVNPLTLKLFR